MPYSVGPKLTAPQLTNYEKLFSSFFRPAAGLIWTGSILNQPIIGGNMKLNMLGFLVFLGLLGFLGTALDYPAFYGLFAMFALFGLFGHKEQNEPQK